MTHNCHYYDVTYIIYDWGVTMHGCVYPVPAGTDWPSIGMLMAAKVTLAAGMAAMWMQTAELYSTRIRATGHSYASVMGKIGDH
jgi:hypothetical protein